MQFITVYDTKEKLKMDNRADCSRFGSETCVRCFLAFVGVEYQDKSDGCEELAVLGKFRDEYIMSSANGRALVEKYNKIAPEIVKQINASEKKDVYYKYISEVVDRCVRLIKVNENERALIEYKFLIKNLKKEFEL